jgi:hypothetical protein
MRGPRDGQARGSIVHPSPGSRQPADDAEVVIHPRLHPICRPQSGRLSEPGRVDDPMNAEGRPAQAPHDQITTTSGSYIVTDPPVRILEAHRRRQVRRLAVIAQVTAAYGVEVDGRLLPPGPECCPRTCEWCRQAVSA